MVSSWAIAMRVWTADTDDTDAAAPRRCRNGNDRVGGGKHPASMIAKTRIRAHFRNEMWTVFENASPTLSVVTPGISATAR